MDWSSFVGYFLAVYFTLVAATYTLQLTVFKKRSYTGKVFSRHWLGHTTFKIFRVTIWFVCVARVFEPEVNKYLILAPCYESIAVTSFGMLLLIGGSFLVWKAHGGMGKYWTSGINESGHYQLVKTGLFRYSRNPIFIGVLICQLGFVFALPSIFSLVCFVVGAASIFSQVNLEENFLRRTFGDEYVKYCQTTPRWLSLKTTQSKA